MALKGIVEGNNYTFSAANKTITFSNDYLGMSLSDITYITNIKNGVATVIYDPFDATKGGDFSGLTLTLAFNTTTMSDGDPLQIIVGFTPINTDPTPVKIVANVHDKDQTELLQNISDNLDLLSKTVDRAEGIEVNVREVTGGVKKDSTNAVIPSDGIVAYETFIPANSTITTPIIDTQGYKAVHFSQNNGNSFNFGGINYSNDGVNFSNPSYTWYQIGSNTPSIITTAGSSGALAFYISQVIGRFCRITYSNQGSTPLKFIVYLRNILPPPYTALNSNGDINVNLRTFGINTQPVGAVRVDSGGNTSGAGFGIGSPNPSGSNSVVYPIMIGGREAPFAGNLAGISRISQTDPQGRFILGTDYDGTRPRDPFSGVAQGPSGTAPVRGVGGIPNNIVGAQSLTVSVANQDFGDTQVMLLRQILTEIKILNQQFHEMPNILNQANFKMSDPQEYRNDGDFDSSIQ